MDILVAENIYLESCGLFLFNKWALHVQVTLSQKGWILMSYGRESILYPTTLGMQWNHNDLPIINLAWKELRKRPILFVN